MAAFSRQDFEALLAPYLAVMHMSLDSTQFAALTHHLNLLLRWNQRLNLTSLAAPPEIARRHFAESLFLANVLLNKKTQARSQKPGENPADQGASARRVPAVRIADISTLADIGSGPGFPGFPIAVLKPSVHVTLVESVGKKAAFLKELCRSFPNVTVMHSRFERLNLCFDCGVLRGVSALHLVPEFAERLRHLALILGSKAAEDLSRGKLFQWAEPMPLPWQPDRVVLLGSLGLEPARDPRRNPI